MKNIRIFFDRAPKEPLVKMVIDDEVYVQLTVKAAVLAARIRGQLEEEYGATRPLLGLAFKYDECVDKGELVIFEQSYKAPVGLYVQMADFARFSEAFNR